MNDFFREYHNNVDEISEELYAYLLDLKLKDTLALKIKIYYENVMLNLEEQGIAHFSITVHKRLGNVRVCMEYLGASFNPFEDLSGEEDEYNEIVCKNLGLESTYQYKKKKNIIVGQYKTPIQLGNLSTLLSAFLGAAIAIVIRIFFSQHSMIIRDEIVTPLFSLFLKLLMLVVAPIMLFSQIATIASFENLKEIKPLLRKFFTRAVLIMLFVGVVSEIIAFLIWGQFENTAAGGQFHISVSTLVNGVPNNILEPILTGNLLWILIFATIVGCGLLSLGERKAVALTLCRDMNDVFTYALQLLCKLMPGFIFLSMVNLFLSIEVDYVKDVLLLLTVAIVLALLLVLIYLKTVAKTTNTEVKDLWLFIRKPVLIALSTASSYAAKSDMYDAANQKPGANKNIFTFIINMGGIVFWPATTISFVIFAIFAKGSLSWVMLICLVPLSIFVAVSTPSVPAAGFVTSTILFNAMGIDSQSIMPVFIIFALVLDYFFTAANVACLMLECYYFDCKWNMSTLDKKNLSKK